MYIYMYIYTYVYTADAGTKTELSIIRAALDNLVTSVSVSLDDEAVSHYLTALSTQVCIYICIYICLDLYTSV